jgi:hypothetical protein
MQEGQEQEQEGLERHEQEQEGGGKSGGPPVVG